MIRSLNNTLAALSMLAHIWKGPMLALIVVESVAITLTLVNGQTTPPSGITHVKRSTVAGVMMVLIQTVMGTI